MKKRTAIRIISFAFAISVVGFGMFLSEKQVTKKYKLMAENDMAESLNGLTSSVDNITDTLNKALYLKSGKDLNKMASRLYAEGELGKEALSNLPGGSRNSGTLYKFLSQVGNYAMALSNADDSDEALSSETTDKLSKLLEISEKIKKAIEETNISYDNLEEFSSLIDRKTDKNIDKSVLATSLDSIEEDLSDYPTLIYDGPFSDHILNKEPLMVSGKKVFTKEECRKKAEKVFSLKANSLEYDGTQDGKIECYRFKNNDITVTLSKKGGYIVYMRKNRDVSENRLNGLKAVNYAKEFMKNLGVTNMVENYYFSDEGVCVINFAYVQNETVCYTDLIKVGVALDTGEIMLFESAGYLTNHTERVFDSPKISVGDARKNVSSLLKIKSSSLALIPTDSAGETRCYEFLCEGKNNQEILVYIGCEKGETENVFILDKSDAGTVVK